MIKINRLLEEGEMIVFEVSKIEELLANRKKINFKLDLDNNILLVETLCNDLEYIKKQIKAFLLKEAQQAESQVKKALQTQKLINKLLQ